MSAFIWQDQVYFPSFPKYISELRELYQPQEKSTWVKEILIKRKKIHPTPADLNCSGVGHANQENGCRPHPARQATPVRTRETPAAPKAKTTTRRASPQIGRNSLPDERSCGLPEIQVTKTTRSKRKQKSGNKTPIQQNTNPEISTKTYNYPQPRCLNTNVRLQSVRVR